MPSKKTITPPRPPEWAQCQAELRTVRAQLELERRRNCDLYELSPLGYLHLNEQGVILQANRTAADLLHATPDELQQQPLAQFIGLEDQYRFAQHCGALLALGQPQSCELRMRRHNGPPFWAHLTGHAIQDGNGAPGISVILSDITARRAAEAARRESEAQFKYALEASRDGLWDWQIQTGEVYFSAQWAQLLGYERNEVPGRVEFFFTLLHPEDAPRVRQLVEDHLAGRTAVKQDEVRLRMKSGEYRWFLDRGKVVQRDATGQPLRMVGTISDITERKDTERRLQQLNRLYAVLGAINQLMVREKNPPAMLTAACRVAVEMGQLRMAWIGLLDGPTRQEVVAASAGEVGGYLEALQPDLQTSARRPSPTTQAIVSGEPLICNDVATDERFAPWRDAALARDYRACGIFPFRIGSRIGGSINLYASEAGFFNAEQVELLDKLAMDLGGALEVYEQEADRRRIEQALLTEHTRLRQIIDSQFGFVVVLSLTAVVVEVNQTPLTLTGLTRNQVLGRRLWEGGWLAPEAEAQCEAAIARAAQGELWRSDVRARMADGTVRDIDTVFSPLRDAAEQVINIVGFGVDVTERNQVAAALRENQRFLATLVSNLPGLVYRCRNDAQWTMTFVSEGCRALTGYEADELEQNRVTAYGDLVHPEDREALWQKCQVALAARTPCDNEYRIRTKHGATRWVWERAAGNYAADGTLVSIEGFVQDITNRKQAEQSLAASQERLRTIFETEPECVKLVGPKGELLEMNPAGLAMLEADSLEQVKAHGLSEFILPNYRTAFSELHRRVMSGVSDLLEFEIRGLRGTQRWLETHATPMRDKSGAVTLLLGITRDVSHRKAAEAALRESEYRWKFAIEGSGDGLWDWDIPKSTVFFTKRWKEMLGFAEDEIGMELGEWENRVHPDDKAQTLRAVQAHLAGQTPVYISEHRVGCKDGSWKWILDRGMVVNRDAANQPLRMIGTHHDITERKQTEEALRHSEQRFRSVVDSLPLGLGVVDSRGRLQLANAAMQTQFGYAAEELLGQTVELLVPKRFRGGHQADREGYHQHGQARPMGRNRDLFGRRRDGSEFPVEIGLQPFQSAEGRMTLAIITDITERKQAEAALRTAEQLAATGRLAAGIAHEINNPLAGIRSAFAIVKAAVPAEHEDLRFARMIDREIERISRIVGQMFHLYKPQAEQPQDVEFNELLHEVAELSHAQATAKSVRLSVEGSPTPLRAFHPAGALAQVLLNLVRNAVHATPAGTTVRLVVVSFQEQIIVTVADQGPGIPEALRERVFEPFFSTKTDQAQTGMGLGLSVSRSLVEMMGGQLELVITPTGETTFCMTLPRKMAPVGAAKGGWGRAPAE